jgi:hypothetical protein
MLLTTSHATCSHVQWYHSLHESHCTQCSPAVSTSPQHCSTGGPLTVVPVADDVCAVVAEDAVAADGVGVCFCRLAPRRLRAARGVGGAADAEEEDAEEADEDDADGAADADDNAVVAAARPYCSMTVSSFAFSSSSDSCLPLTLSRMSDTSWRCL